MNEIKKLKREAEKLYRESIKLKSRIATLERDQNKAKGLLSTRNLVIDAIIDDYCNKLDLEKDVLLSRTRMYPFIIYRQVMTYQLRQKGYSYSEIGRYFDNNHGTILYSVKKVNDMIEVKDELYFPIYKKLNYD